MQAVLCCHFNSYSCYCSWCNVLTDNTLSPGHESEVTTAILRIVCFHKVWPCCSTAYWGGFRTCSMLMLSSAVWWCFPNAVLVQIGLALNCPVGKYICFPMLPAYICKEREWIIPLDCITAPEVCSSLGIWGVFLFSKNCCVVEDNRVCLDPPRWHNKHLCLWCGCFVSCCDFLSPQLMCLHYSMQLLNCRSAIVLTLEALTLEAHAVTWPQVLTLCSNHHTQLWGVHPAVYGSAHGVSTFWSVSCSHSVFCFPWDCVVSCSVAVSLQWCCITANSNGYGGPPGSLCLYA